MSKKDSQIMMTVKMLAYNHEKYIEKAIESIVSQKTEYRYELLIGDDCSTDSTRDIILKYKKMYPDIIRVIFQHKNVGCTKNSYTLDKLARGKYIAGCEGDDYWCDDTRIQRDIEFLENNPSYVGINHKCRVVDEEGNPLDMEDIPERNRFFVFDKQVFTLKDYESWKMPGHSNALTGRNLFLEKGSNYSIVYKASKSVGDRTHLLMYILQGDIYCQEDIVSCYRYRISNDNNFMSMQSRYNCKADDFAAMCRLEKWARLAKGIKLDLSKVKKDRLAASVVIWMKNPNINNLRVVFNIWKASNRKISYIYYIIKTIVLKSYYWKIKKTDKIIEL